MNDYDQVPYHSHPYRLSHPDHLAAVAALHGLDPVPVDGARVLEVGCNMGGNLLPLAAAHPGATFVGVDPAAHAMARARARVAQLGLTNVELHEIGIEQLPDGPPFDYVIAHGVLSWIPEPARAALFGTLERRLSERGVAYLSFNTLPGWAVRDVLCQAMRRHVRHLGDARAKVTEARALVDRLCEINAADTEWGRLLHTERDRMEKHGDWFLLHDHLAEHNRPFWFHEVDERARAHGLRFLAESEPWRSVEPPELERLTEGASTVEEREHRLDLARNTVFRETLWVRSGPGTLHPSAEHLRALSFRLRGHRTEEDGCWVTPAGAKVTATHPTAHALLDTLGTGSTALGFAELCAGVEARLGEVDPDEVAANLLPLVLAHAAVHVHRWPRPVAHLLTARPMAFRYARLQAAEDEVRVTNLRHEALKIDDFERFLLVHLDGAHDRDRLVQQIRDAISRGELVLELRDDESGPESLEEAIDRVLLAALLRIARSALLVR
ncbi:MAG: methyltransferase regulatory domain-containing protein [Alphaproteobacteria bacterium]|nr:methyltransferase regulatory domain-containing protein [Alphaproteobacteria bacterium]